jgi:glyoxylase-like metal-dependent hydrolase (beta-lactamase superfamily II)
MSGEATAINPPMRTTPTIRGRLAALGFGLAALGMVSACRADRTWFKVTPVAAGVRCISDDGAVNAYLIEGTERALLVDTGTGRRDLARCVAGLTKLPVEVVVTHGHSDHAGGAVPFGRAYAHPADWDLVRRSVRGGDQLQLSAVRAGYRFELGDRPIEVIEVPGHTAGSICLLDVAHRLLFAGDNDNTTVWLFLKECLPLEAYLASLRNLNRRVGEFDTILPGHGAPIDAAFIQEQIACAEQIVSGACKGKPYRWHGGWALQCTFKRATIAFDANNLHAKR